MISKTEWLFSRPATFKVVYQFHSDMTEIKKAIFCMKAIFYSNSLEMGATLN